MLAVPNPQFVKPSTRRAESPVNDRMAASSRSTPTARMRWPLRVRRLSFIPLRIPTPSAAQATGVTSQNSDRTMAIGAPSVKASVDTTSSTNDATPVDQRTRGSQASRDVRRGRVGSGSALTSPIVAAMTQDATGMPMRPATTAITYEIHTMSSPNALSSDSASICSSKRSRYEINAPTMNRLPISRIRSGCARNERTAADHRPRPA